MFDFELGKTVDERILIKKLSDAMDKKQKRSVEVDVKIQTGHLVLFLVLR